MLGVLKKGAMYLRVAPCVLSVCELLKSPSPKGSFLASM